MEQPQDGLDNITISEHTLPSVHRRNSEHSLNIPSETVNHPQQETTGTNPCASTSVIHPRTIHIDLSRMALNDRERLIQQQLAQFMMQMGRGVGQAPPQGHLPIPQHLLQQVNPGPQQAAPHPHSHAHSHSHQHPTNEIPHRADTVLELNGDVSGNNNNNPPTQAAGNQANRRARRPEGLREQMEGIPGMNVLMANMTGALPFLVLLFVKVMYNHRLGLLIFVGMFGTFYYSNSSLKKLLALRENQLWTEAVSGYVCIFWFLAANILFFYYIFDDQKLYRCLYFLSPEMLDMDVWSLMWVTVATDFNIKFGTIAIKSVVAVLPKHVLPCRKKGKYFLLLEMVSQFYRSIVPLPRWATFILDNRYGGPWMAIILFIVYCVFKGLHLKLKAAKIMRGIKRFKVDVSFGTAPNREDLKSFDNSCPICQDSFCDPIKLSCNHVFCDDCISLWLNREKTCPMCRAHISDNPVWRDGATSSVIQFY